jgi:hypothetical protein
MLVIKENERLYPDSWSYNIALILTELAKIVANNGGKVKPLCNAIISNRSVTAAINDYQNKIDRLSTLDKTEEIDKLIAKYTAELEKYKAINNEPITVTHTSYISFVLDGMYYSYSTDDNPFFPFYAMKTPVKDGKYSKDACSVEDEKEWLYDCFLYANCSDADRKEAANLIFNQLVKMPVSVIRRDSKRCRVSNTYNSGYHYETIYGPERFGTIDF